MKKSLYNYPAKKLFELIINTASGNQTLSELQSYGDSEFNPRHLGIVN